MATLQFRLFNRLCHFLFSFRLISVFCHIDYSSVFVFRLFVCFPNIPIWYLSIVDHLWFRVATHFVSLQWKEQNKIYHLWFWSKLWNSKHELTLTSWNLDLLKTCYKTNQVTSQTIMYVLISYLHWLWSTGGSRYLRTWNSRFNLSP